MAVQTQIQVRRGTASSWTSTNPTLAAGEWGLETDTGKYKVGDGSSVWTGLGYASILPSTVTTKGDLLAATGSGAVSRLAAGSNGFTLVADSSTSTGLAYAGATNGNPTINGAFDIWQRGTSISVTSATATYTADRWNAYSNGNALTVSRQSVSDSTNLPNIQYCARVQRNSGQTSTNGVQFVQSFETAMSIPYAGRTVTVSFYARSGSNFSAASNALKFYLLQGTGTNQLRQTSAYTGESDAISNQTATLTTTWQRFSFTGSIASTATEFTTYFAYTPSGTASTNDYYEITGVQIDLGSTALPFRRSGGTIQGELAAAQRYYVRYTGVDQTPVGVGSANSTTNARVQVHFPVEMRTTPSAIDSGGSWWFWDGANLSSASSFSGYSLYNKSAILNATSSSLTQFRPYFLIAANDTTAYIGLSAEL